jgi:hypothetical protein
MHGAALVAYIISWTLTPIPYVCILLMCTRYTRKKNPKMFFILAGIAWVVFVFILAMAIIFGTWE